MATMRILAIETSCDDTGIAVIEVKSGKSPRFSVLANVISSQIKLHAKYGGVFPSLAKREHLKNLPIVLKKALKESRNPKMDIISVTAGPGLEPCLWTGINFAKEIAEKMKLPLIPVNHIEAHILANFTRANPKPVFPAVCLVVSGGHTQIILMKDIGKYKLLGETRDDAAGECFDKIARILGLGYPGGPIVSQLARKFSGERTLPSLPRPMINSKDYDFSFSGLKTAVLYLAKELKEKKQLTKAKIREICFDAQQSIIDVLLKKTIKAARDYNTKAIILGGGVTANEELRKQFKIKSSKFNINLFVPPKELSTDNALMIGVAAYFHKTWRLKNWKLLKANANLKLANQ